MPPPTSANPTPPWPSWRALWISFFLPRDIRRAIWLPRHDLTEIIVKTECALEHVPDARRGLLSYMSGYCILNERLSKGVVLDGNEQSQKDVLERALKTVQPLSYPVVLFHGFERFLGTDYPRKFERGDTVNMPIFMSKTPIFDVAWRFAWATVEIPSVLAIRHAAGSRHLHPDVIQNTPEWEYLAAPQPYRVESVHWIWIGLFPGVPWNQMARIVVARAI